MFNLMKRPTALQAHVHTSTNCIPLLAVVHSCELRSPNLYEGLEITLYEGLGISFKIRVLNVDTLMLYPLDDTSPYRKGVGISVSRQQRLQEGREDDSERKTLITHGRGWANGSTPAILRDFCNIQHEKGRDSPLFGYFRIA
jgi:hypothetical protein